MKKTISILLALMLVTGCSTKSSYMKKGAIIGGVAGVGTVVAIGTKDTNSDYAGTIAVVAVIMGLAGVATGAGVGYLVDKVTEDEQDKQMQDIMQSQNIQGL